MFFARKMTGCPARLATAKAELPMRLDRETRVSARLCLLAAARASSLVVIVLGCSSPLDAATFSFTPLGDLPGGTFQSLALAISADGSTVVGAGQSATGRMAFRWTTELGMAELGTTPGDVESTATGLSADGSVIAGYTGSFPQLQAFRWTELGGTTSLSTSPAGFSSAYATGISGDGSIVVGVGNTGMTSAFSWDETNGMVDLGHLSEVENSQALAISNDGSTIVGESWGLLGPTSFRWTAQTGMVALSDSMPFPNLAMDVSADGAVVVGRIIEPGGTEAYRWTEADGIIKLGDLPGGGIDSEASAVSADGTVVAGRGWSSDGAEAFVWTAETGMKSVAAILSSAGVDLSGWRLEAATDLSGDGRTIVGFGVNPDGRYEGWVATLPFIAVPEPSTLVLSLAALVGLIFWRCSRR